MNFGKEDLCIKIEFSWKDALKNDNWSSYNINFEYFSNLFNLGVCYYNLGLSIPITEDEGRLRESIKNFQYASWIFDNIKNEVSNTIPVKETPPDLTSNYLTYVNFIL
jgi:hypothetical protein